MTKVTSLSESVRPGYPGLSMNRVLSKPAKPTICIMVCIQKYTHMSGGLLDNRSCFPPPPSKENSLWIPFTRHGDRLTERKFSSSLQGPFGIDLLETPASISKQVNLFQYLEGASEQGRQPTRSLSIAWRSPV